MSYPRSLVYAVNRLAGYSTTLVKLRCNQNESAKAGDVISFDLPANSIVSLDSLRLCGKITTTAAIGANIRHADGLIRQVIVEAGGQIIQNGADHTPILWNMLNDMSAGDKLGQRFPYQASKALTAAPTVPLDQDFFISSFLGFTSSAKPDYIDTSLFPGTMRVSFRLNDNGVLMLAGAASYTLSNLYMLVRVCDISDGIYYNVLAERLRQGDIEIPFTNIVSFIGGDRTSSTSSSMQFSITSQSVDMLIGTVIPKAGSSTGGFLSGTVQTSSIENVLYYSRGAFGGTAPNVSWKVNNIQHPSFGAMSAMDCYSETLNSLGALNDTVGAIVPAAMTASLWEKYYFMSAYRLSHPSDGADDRTLSGLNALGTSSVCSFDYSQTTAESFQPIVFVMSTAVLKLGAGRTMAITY
jgi:hypothetical protein